MKVLTELEPKGVFYFFEEICRIPHGSGNVEQISDFLVEFAKERNLIYRQDELKNVMIEKPASKGYEQEPAVILQGHMDMVAVKKPGLQKDMKTEGLDVRVNGDKIYAEGTSLGGDDGIAVAYALAILADDTLAHPRLEVVITVDEEIGMDGARGIDLSALTGKRMLNLDSEEEGIFLTSCAGGARVNCHLPLGQEEKNGQVFRISVEGLLGGHSGEAIDKERGNANCILGRLIYSITQEIPVNLISLEGGLADNAIPRQAVAEIVINRDDYQRLQKVIIEREAEIGKELVVKDPDFQVTVVSEGESRVLCADQKSTEMAAAFLLSLPNGVQAMSADIKELVETSLNLGIMKYSTDSKQLTCSFSVRSCMESAKQNLIAKLKAITDIVQGSVTVNGDYPGWAYRADSPLRDKMVALYEEMYGRKPELMAIHAGLECGILASKIENLDCISFGPNMENIHTTEETLSISSTKRVWEYLINLLKKKG
ncbi:MAG TPA: aminoacyl-histidine dipeptidase [Lachnospiraceae bacterium]|nr:aminoacyl-histidine dipeptidase [Lachnospiraceae bacterium]